MATIVVEDGTVVTGANSYCTTDELDTYASDRGYTLTGTYGDQSEILIKANDYLEGQDFIGVKSSRAQPLVWPRYDVYIEGWLQPSNTIPPELKTAQLAIALAIDAGNDPLAVIDRAVKREKVDVIEIEYQDNAADAEIIRSIAHPLKKLLRPGGIRVMRA